MSEEQQDPFKELPEAVYGHMTASYLHQDQLSWGRTQLLVAVEAGTLAAAFSLRPLAVYVLGLGTILVLAVWRLVERDWEVRDQNLDSLDRVHKPLGVRIAKAPRNTFWRGSTILRTVFVGLIALNIMLGVLFVVAGSCDCRTLDVFRMPADNKAMQTDRPSAGR